MMDAVDVQALGRSDPPTERDPFELLPLGRTIARRAAVGTAALIAVLTVVGWLLTELEPLADVRSWDESINDELATGRSGWASELGESVTAIGDTRPIVLINAAILVVLAAFRRWRAMVFVPMALLVEILTFVSVNWLVGRPRPSVERLGPLPGTDSFPSGHIAATFVCWMGVAILLQLHGRILVARVVGVVAIALTIAMGWARVYVGMHHLLDVVVGLLMGVAAVAVALWALGLRFRRQQSGPGMLIVMPTTKPS